MSPFALRLLATACTAGLGTLAAGLPAAAAGAWAPAGALPGRLDAPVFALAVDPAGGARLLAGIADTGGTAGGGVLRSDDGGASWRVVRSGLGRGVAALAFDPFHPGTVLAGALGDGVWRSADGGLTWQQQAGTEGRTVRAVAFLPGAALAGSDHGVLVSREGGPWAAGGLGHVRVSALAAAAPASADAAPLVVAGGDGTEGGEPLPLFVSGDSGRTWTAVPAGGGQPFAGSAMVSALAAGRTLLLGTDAGLFASADRGATWQQVTGSGAGGLPGTDFTAAVVAPGHPERVYVASDGGGTDRGGLWASSDGGAHFAALAPPQPAVTAIAVSADEAPELVVATFRPADHAAAVWTYRDGAGAPAAAAAPPPAPAARAPSPAAGPPAARPVPWRTLLAEPETPYLAVAAACLLALVAALAAHARRGRPRWRRGR